MFYNSIVLILFSLFQWGSCDQLSQARTDFYGINTEQDVSNFLSKYSPNGCGAIPAYRAAVYMRQAQFTSLPNKKLKYFNTGKKQLEGYIASHPNDLEGRFNRYLVQKSLPKILNYSSNLSEDLSFIKKNLDASSIAPEYKKKMLNTINNLE